MTTTFRITGLMAGIATLALAACTSMPTSETAARASAASPSGTAPRAGVLATVSTVQEVPVNLVPASGSLVSGRLTLRPMGDGVHLTGEIGGLPRNSTHAIHLHEKGDCSAADASSAGGHFNPANHPHGRIGTGAHHAGDMNNIVSDASGVAKVDHHSSGTVLGGGALNDAIGRAVVVHAEPDDYTSQPSGAAGARVACGVIQARK